VFSSKATYRSLLVLKHLNEKKHLVGFFVQVSHAVCNHKKLGRFRPAAVALKTGKTGAMFINYFYKN
jgi:hypothetical protein